MSKQSSTLKSKAADLYQTSIITNRCKIISVIKSKICIEKYTMRWEMPAKKQLKKPTTLSKLPQQWKALIWRKVRVERDLSLEIICKSQLLGLVWQLLEVQLNNLVNNFQKLKIGRALWLLLINKN